MKRRFLNASKKLVATAMCAAMAVTSVLALMPMDVNAVVYENATEIDCTGWWVAHTGGYEVDETGVEVSFNFQTYADTDSFTAGNWHAPLVVVYSSDDGLVGGDNYTEYEVIRSDFYAWVGAMNSGLAYSDWYNAGHRKTELFNPDWWVENSYNGGDFTWASWLDNNQTGASGKVLAIREGNYVSVKVCINGVECIWEVPVPSDKDINIALTGEYCKITNIQSKAYSGDYVYAPAWWSSKTAGFRVDDDGLNLTFDSKTNSSATGNYETPILIVYTGNVNYVGGDGYSEYCIIRSDVAGWKTNATSFELVRTQEANWDTYLATHKAGTSSTVNATLEGSNLVIVFENADGISTTTVAVDPTKEIYISVSGQNCEVSNIKEVDTNTETLEIIGAQTREASDSKYDLGFVTTIDKTTFESMQENIVEMGVVLKNDANLTSLAMLETNASDTALVRKVTTDYVTDLSNLDETQTDTSVYAFRTIVKGISAEYKNYTAVPYVTYMDGEEEVTVYGDAITRCIHDCK